MPPDLLNPRSSWPDFMRVAWDIVYRLRRNYEGCGSELQHRLILSSISGYVVEFPDRALVPTDAPGIGLATHFVRWLQAHPPAGGGPDGEELRDWISKFPV